MQIFKLSQITLNVITLAEFPVLAGFVFCMYAILGGELKTRNVEISCLNNITLNKCFIN